MDLNVYIQLIFLSVVNIIFTFLGIVSNTLVIVSFWKSSHATSKEIMSFHDHGVVVFRSGRSRDDLSRNAPLSYLLVKEDYDLLLKLKIYLHIFEGALGFSFLTFLVMNIERYLGAYYLIFHHTSVTKRRLLTLLATLLIPTIVMYIMSRNALVIPDSVYLIVYNALFFPPFMFVNFKLFIIATKVHRERAVSPGKRTRKNFKNISMGLWAVVILMLSFLPSSFYIAFNLAEKSTNTIRLSFLWQLTSVTMNCTFNSLIFFWKNKVLRTEGIDTKNVERSFCRILSKDFIDLRCVSQYFVAATLFSKIGYELY